MKFKQAKRLSESLSVIGLGCWAFSGSDYWDSSNDGKSIAIMKAALDVGVNLLDVALVCGKGNAEEVVSRAIKGRDRKSFLIASSCSLLRDDSGREYNCLKKDGVLREIDASLARIGVDYIGIYQLHWLDPGTHLEEALEAIVRILPTEKIRHFGVANFSTEDVNFLSSMEPNLNLRALDWEISPEMRKEIDSGVAPFEFL